MKKHFTLENLDQVKALADPLRMQVLQAVCQKPMTTKQVAILLGEKPTKLYHHVDILERAGLITMVETKKTRGTVEKYYSGVAKAFAVDGKLFAVAFDQPESAAELGNAFVSVLETTLAELRKSISAKLIKSEDQNRSATAAHLQILSTKEQAAELLEKIKGWVAECRAAGNEQGDMYYGMTIAFYPVKEKKERHTIDPAQER